MQEKRGLALHAKKADLLSAKCADLLSAQQLHGGLALRQKARTCSPRKTGNEVPGTINLPLASSAAKRRAPERSHRGDAADFRLRYFGPYSRVARSLQPKKSIYIDKH